MNISGVTDGGQRGESTPGKLNEKLATTWLI